MSTRVTRWLSIDDDGQPTLPGWYEVLYDGSDSDRDVDDDCLWWDGRVWRFGPDKRQSGYGNWNTEGERWRGLAKDPASPQAAPQGKEGGAS